MNNTKTTSPQQPVSGYSLVNGISMYYEIYGQGQPLVLIHGGGSTLETSFGRVIPLFAKTRQVIAVELQGLLFLYCSWQFLFYCFYFS